MSSSEEESESVVISTPPNVLSAAQHLHDNLLPSKSKDLVAKPVSLNELIAAETKQKQTKGHSKTTGRKTISLNELIAAESKQNEKKLPVKPKEDNKRSGGETKTKPVSVKENYPAESLQKLRKPHFPKTSAKKPRRKSFSLKDLFTSESRPAKRRIESLLPKRPGLFPHRRSLFPALSRRPFESVEDIFSPLKFKKKFEIKSPLRPKKIKYSFGSRLKRRNQSSKREVSDNEVFGHKIPLIKRLGLLMGDILSPESSESTERITRRKQRRNRQKSSNNNKNRPDLASSESKPQQTAIAAPTTESPETTTNINTETADTEDPTSETPDTTTYNTTSGDVNTLRPDTDVSLPPARNTGSDRRDDHGVSERSGTTLHRNDKGYITRNNRSHEHHTRGKGNETYPSYYEEDSCSPTRVSKCHDGPDRTRDNNDHETKKAETTSNRFRRNDTERKDIFEIGPLQIPRNIRLRGPVSDKVVVVEAESVPPEKSREEGFDSFTVNHTSAERRSDRDGTTAAEDQRIRQVIEGVRPIQDLIRPDFLKRGQQNPVVTIFDGYSVARDINGRNELTEKSIRISPN